MKNVKFQDHKQAQAHKLVDDKGRARKLVSYNTTVIDIDENGWMVVHGLYSATTIRHIGWFMRELGYSYFTAKKLYMDNLKMNLFTGEVKAV